MLILILLFHLLLLYQFPLLVHLKLIIAVLLRAILLILPFVGYHHLSYLFFCSILGVLILSKSIYFCEISCCFFIGKYLNIPLLACNANIIFSLIVRSPTIPSTFLSSGQKPKPSSIAF